MMIIMNKVNKDYFLNARMQGPSFGLFEDIVKVLKDPNMDDLQNNYKPDLYTMDIETLTYLKHFVDDGINTLDTTELTAASLYPLLLNGNYRLIARIASFRLGFHVQWDSNTRYMHLLYERPDDEDERLPSISKLQKLLYKKSPKEFYLMSFDKIPPSFLQTVLGMIKEDDFNLLKEYYCIASTEKKTIINCIVKWVYMPISKSISIDTTKDISIPINEAYLNPFGSNFKSFSSYFSQLKEFVYLQDLYNLQHELKALFSSIQPKIINKRIQVSHWHIKAIPISTISKIQSSKFSFSYSEVNIHINMTCLSKKMFELWNEVKVNDVVCLLTIGESNFSFCALALVLAVSKQLNGTEIVIKLQFKGKSTGRFDCLYFGGSTLFHHSKLLQTNFIPSSGIYLGAYNDAIPIYTIKNEKDDYFITLSSGVHRIKAHSDKILEFIQQSSLSVAYYTNNESKLQEIASDCRKTGVAPYYPNSREIVFAIITSTINEIKSFALQLCTLLQLNKSHCEDALKIKTLLTFHVLGWLKTTHKQQLNHTITDKDATMLTSLLTHYHCDFEQLISKVTELLELLQLYGPLSMLSTDDQKYDYYMAHCGQIYLISSQYLIQNPKEFKISILLIDAVSPVDLYAIGYLYKHVKSIILLQ